MAHTERKKPHNPYSHEEAVARKMTRKANRVKAAQLMRQGKFDLATTRVAKGTGGWLSW